MKSALTILVVDDEENAHFMLEHLASLMGHQCVHARNGLEAVEAYRSSAPDLVLMDVMMPELDGFGATERIRAIPTDKWVPVIYLSALPRKDNIMRGFAAGGDDYLVKPFNMAELQAKIRSLERVAYLQRNLHKKREALAYHIQRTEEEVRIGSHLMASLTQLANMEGAGLQYWSRPLHRFSGDLVAAARTPANVLHLMVADAVGHGLPAALSVMPLADAFYRLTASGYSLAHIIEELDGKIKRLLPRDRFVAATLAAFDVYRGELQIWNGGNPAPFYVDSDGQVQELTMSRQLPLGLLNDVLFEAQPDILMLPGPGQLLMFTDGLCEAQDEEGTYFDTERIARALARAAPAERFRHLSSCFARHIGTRAIQDDASYLLADLDTAVPPDWGMPVPLATEGEVDWSASFTLGARELRSLDAVPFLTSVVEKLESSAAHRRQVFVILSELFNNALEHGLLGLSSQLKDSAAGFDAFMRERRERLSALRAGRIDLQMERVSSPDISFLRIRVRDSGPGFDYRAQLAAPAEAEFKPYGRGLLLVRSLCLRLEFAGKGNEAVAEFVL